MSKPPREMASELSKILKRIQQIRFNQEIDISGINATVNEIKSNQADNDLRSWYQLCDQYQKIYETAVSELLNVEYALKKIREICNKRENKPRKRRASEVSTTSPALMTPQEYSKRQKAARGSMTPQELRASGLIWYHEDMVLQPQTEVAALVDANSIPKVWILARILSYRAGTGREERYEVVDADEQGEQDTYRKTYHLHPTKIIPLPSLELVPLSGRKIFQRNERVLGVFPGTTTLYPCNIVTPPKKGKDAYQVMFDDDDGLTRTLKACRIAPIADDFYQ